VIEAMESRVQTVGR